MWRPAAAFSCLCMRLNFDVAFAIETAAVFTHIKAGVLAVMTPSGITHRDKRQFVQKAEGSLRRGNGAHERHARCGTRCRRSLVLPAGAGAREVSNRYLCLEDDLWRQLERCASSLPRAWSRLEPLVVAATSRVAPKVAGH